MINIRLLGNYQCTFSDMEGYDCAGETGTCKCYGKVNFGFYEGSGMFFGNWSEMRDARGAIGCEKTNFVGGDNTGTDMYDQECMCYPSSNFILLLVLKGHIRL